MMDQGDYCISLEPNGSCLWLDKFTSLLTLLYIAFTRTPVSHRWKVHGPIGLWHIMFLQEETKDDTM